MAEPFQLPLFPDQAALTRIQPERNECRFYRLAVCPDLFGRALLARHWGRIGTRGRIRLDPHPSPAPPSTPSPGSPAANAAAATRTAQRDPAAGTHDSADKTDWEARHGVARPTNRSSIPPTKARPPAVVPRKRAATALPAPTAVGGSTPLTAGRKYVAAGERDAFLREGEHADRRGRTLCMTPAYAGGRLSEALAPTADRVDPAAGVLTIESVKKRRTSVFGAVPVPPALLDADRLGARHPRAAIPPLQGAWAASLPVVADERLARRASSHGGRRAGRAAGLAQGAAAQLRGDDGLRRHSAQPGAKMARPRPAHHTAIYVDAVGPSRRTLPEGCGRKSQVGSYRETLLRGHQRAQPAHSPHEIEDEHRSAGLPKSARSCITL